MKVLSYNLSYIKYENNASKEAWLTTKISVLGNFPGIVEISRLAKLTFFC